VNIFCPSRKHIPILKEKRNTSKIQEAVIIEHKELGTVVHAHLQPQRSK